MNDKVDKTAAENGAEVTVAGNGSEVGTELADADVVTATAGKPSDSPPDGTDTNGREERQRAGRSWVSTLLSLCLILAGIGAGGYFVLDVQESRKTDLAQRQLLAERLDALQQGHDLLAETLRRLENRQSDNDRQIGEVLQRLHTLQHRTGGETGWKFAEIEYLLRVASLRLTLARDVDTAQAVLHSVDALLRQIPDPALIPVRESLIRAVNRLQAHPRTDFSGIALALGDLAAHAGQLPLKRGADRHTSAGEARQPDTQTRWQQLADTVWQELKSLVVITREGGDSVALLAPSERFFLHRNLRLQLDAARLALLARDQNQYLASLRACADWLEEFFDTDDAGVRSALDILQAAAEVGPDQPLPSIDATLNAFHEYLMRQGSPGTSEGR